MNIPLSGVYRLLTGGLYNRMISRDQADPELRAFWTEMAQKLFWNVNMLYEQIETHYAEKSPEDGPGPQMAVRVITLDGVTTTLGD